MKTTTQKYKVTLYFYEIEAETARQAIDRVTILNRGAIEPDDVSTDIVKPDEDDDD